MPRALLTLNTVVLLCTLLSTGCSPQEILGRVEGRVTFEGEPVAGARILFQNAELGVYIVAPLDDDGKYRVEMAQGYGLPLGEYEVAISPPPETFVLGPRLDSSQTTEADPFPNIPPKYRDPKTSEIVLVVVEGGVNRCDVAMKAGE